MLTSILPLPQPKYDTDAKIRNFYRGVLRELQSKPGIVAAAFASDAPFTSEGDTEGYRVEGEPPPRDASQAPDALYREVTPNYLSAVGARLVEGRPAPRTFALVYRQQDRALAPADVQKIAEGFLLWNGNHTWKVVDVAPAADGSIGFALATPEGSVIARFAMDPHSGRVTRAG